MNGQPNMTPQETMIDTYVTETELMLVRLGDYLITLDELRDGQKLAALSRFGFSHDPNAHEGPARQIVESHLERYDCHMATFLRYAHITLVYLVFEDRLAAFGKIIAAIRKGALEFTGKGKGSLIVKFENYLNRLSLAVPDGVGVETLRLVRNCIVHCNGNTGKFRDREALKLALLHHQPEITIGADGKLVLTTSGCLELQEIVSTYLHEINSTAGLRLWVPPEVRRNFETHLRPFLERQLDREQSI